MAHIIIFIIIKVKKAKDIFDKNALAGIAFPLFQFLWIKKQKDIDVLNLTSCCYSCSYIIVLWFL